MDRQPVVMSRFRPSSCSRVMEMNYDFHLPWAGVDTDNICCEDQYQNTDHLDQPSLALNNQTLVIYLSQVQICSLTSH